MQEKLQREDCMSFEGFCTYIKNGIQQRLGYSCQVMTHNHLKNNGVTLCGLTIMTKESNISPTIYLNGFYERYVYETESLQQIEADVMETYRRNKTDHNLDVSFFTEWENARQRIIFKLVNYDANRELLKDVPYKKVLDLAMVFTCLVEKGVTGSATILIHNHHMECWKVTEDDLFHTAMENTPYFQKKKLTGMDSVIEYLTGQKLGNDILDDICSMYVLTVENNLNGAGAVLYKDLLKGFADRMESDFYILPSSVHEMILIPLFTDDMESLSQMVKEVNATQLKPEDVLSDHAYVYRRADNTISMRGETLCLSDLY